MATCLVGLGSNLGDRPEHIERAIEAIAVCGQLLAKSQMHSTRPIGGPAGQSDFINAAALLQTDRSPQELLVALQAVEQLLGRRRAERWGPRPMDLDILLYDRLILNLPTLVIPHPRFAFRRFMLSPAAEVAGHMLHPTTGFTVEELRARLDQRPIHVAIVDAEASTVAAAAAEQVSGLFWERPDRSADSLASPAAALEFLAGVEQEWHKVVDQNPSVVISNFWVGEVWTTIDTDWTAADRLECQAAWNALPPPLVAPHLVIWLQSSTSSLAHREQLRERLHRPRQFPLLTLEDTSTEAALVEILAAVEAING